MSVEMMLAGVGAGMANNGMQAMFQDRADANWRENQAYAQKLAQDAQRNSMLNLIEGAKKAGISPAVVANGNFSPAVAGSALMQQRSALPLDMASMFQVQKAGEVADAQVKNLEEETRAQRIRNDREAQSDANYNRMMLNVVNTWLEDTPKEDKELRELYEDILREPDSFNKGTFDALRDITDYNAFVKESFARGSEARLRQVVADLQNRGGIYKAIAEMPEENLKLMYQEEILKEALAANAYAQSKSEGERLKVLQEQQKEIAAQAEKIAEETKRIRYGKYGNMYQHGDFKTAIAEIAGNTAEVLGEEVAHEGAKFGADFARAKTGTPHGLIRSESKRAPERRESGSEEWKDRRGVTHRRNYEDAFPLPDNY